MIEIVIIVQQCPVFIHWKSFCCSWRMRGHQSSSPQETQTRWDSIV